MGCSSTECCSQPARFTHTTILCVPHSLPASSTWPQEIRLEGGDDSRLLGQEELNRPHQIKQCNLFVLHIMPYVPPSIIFPTGGVCVSPLPCSRKKKKGNGQAIGPLSVSESEAGGMRESQQEVEAKRREEGWWQRDPAPTSPATLSLLQRGRRNIPLSPSHGVRQGFPRNGETGLKSL